MSQQPQQPQAQNQQQQQQEEEGTAVGVSPATLSKDSPSVQLWNPIRFTRLSTNRENAVLMNEEEAREEFSRRSRGDAPLAPLRDVRAGKDFETGEIIVTEPPVAIESHVKPVNKDGLNTFSSRDLVAMRARAFLDLDGRSCDKLNLRFLHDALVKRAAQQPDSDKKLGEGFRAKLAELAKLIKDDEEAFDRLSEHRRAQRAKEDQTIDQYLKDLLHKESLAQKQESDAEAAEDEEEEEQEEEEGGRPVDDPKDDPEEKEEDGGEKPPPAVVSHKLADLDDAYLERHETIRKCVERGARAVHEHNLVALNKKAPADMLHNAYSVPNIREYTPRKEDRKRAFANSYSRGSRWMDLCRNILYRSLYLPEEKRTIQRLSGGVFKCYADIVRAYFPLPDPVAKGHKHGYLLSKGNQRCMHGEAFGLHHEFSGRFSLEYIEDLWIRLVTNARPGKSALYAQTQMAHSIGLWPIVSMLNHSCNPNCRMMVVHGAALLLTLRPVKKGEPLTIHYCQDYGSNTLTLIETPQKCNELSPLIVFANGFQPWTMEERDMLHHGRQDMTNLPPMRGFLERRMTGCFCEVCSKRDRSGIYEFGESKPGQDALRSLTDVLSRLEVNTNSNNNNSAGDADKENEGQPSNVTPDLKATVPEAFPTMEDGTAVPNNYSQQIADHVIADIDAKFMEKRRAAMRTIRQAKKSTDKKTDAAEEKEKEEEEDDESTWDMQDEEIITRMRSEALRKYKFFLTACEQDGARAYRMAGEDFVQKQMFRIDMPYEEHKRAQEKFKLLDEKLAEARKAENECEEALNAAQQKSNTKRKTIDKLQKAVEEAKQATKAISVQLNAFREERNQHVPASDCYLMHVVRAFGVAHNMDLIDNLLICLLQTDVRDLDYEKTGLFRIMWHTVLFYLPAAVHRQRNLATTRTRDPPANQMCSPLYLWKCLFLFAFERFYAIVIDWSQEQNEDGEYINQSRPFSEMDAVHQEDLMQEVLRFAANVKEYTPFVNVFHFDLIPPIVYYLTGAHTVISPMGGEILKLFVYTYSSALDSAHLAYLANRYKALRDATNADATLTPASPETTPTPTPTKDNK